MDQSFFLLLLPGIQQTINLMYFFFDCKKLLNQGKLFFVSLQRLFAAPDRIVNPLPADPPLFRDFAKREIFQNKLFVYFFLIVCQQFTVKII